MAGAWREVRVFVSSTFRDMQAERDHLVRFVFPRLREDLLGRRLHLVDVDLRWGVTEEQDAFDLCMAEIEHCRPRFVCILGGRYGWTPPPGTLPREEMERIRGGESPAGDLGPDQAGALDRTYALDPDGGLYRLRDKPRATAEFKAWARDADVAVEAMQAAGLQQVSRSITASEVAHGALGREEATFRHFYFRDPAVTDSIPEPHADTYRERAGSVPERLLGELKGDVGNAKGKVEVAPGVEEEQDFPARVYPCRWDPVAERITDLKEFGDLVHGDLLASVVAQFGAEPAAKRDVFAEETFLAEAFVETALERYVVGSRRPVLDALRAHAEGDGGNGYACVVGAPGSGKSALVARLFSDYVGGADGHPPRDGELVVAHFVGVNAANVRELLRRLCHELAARAGVPDEVPADYDGLRDALPALLERAAKATRVVLLVDAVNQLDATHGAAATDWLPSRLPAGARVVLTALPGPALEALRGRPEPPEELALQPLSEGDATAIVEAFLARYRKQLDPLQRDLLLGKRDAGKPLYLVSALEELRTLGTYEEITDRIAGMPGSTQPLFSWILRRLEQDPGFRDAAGRPTGEEVVRRYCSCLALGRSGMAQAELRELAAPPAEPGGEADSEGNVAALERLLRPYLMRRGELLDFFHPQLEEAARHRYLEDGQARRDAHRALAAHFRARADPTGEGAWDGRYPRGLGELPYHLTEGAGDDEERWDELAATLTDFRFLERKAADVGALERTGPDGDQTTLYTGPFLLQDDFALALERMPGGGSGAGPGRGPVILTAVDAGGGPEVTCPHCHQKHLLGADQLDTVIDCPTGGCGRPLRINPFVVERAAAGG